jgi:hypothetical protein
MQAQQLQRQRWSRRKPREADIIYRRAWPSVTPAHPVLVVEDRPCFNHFVSLGQYLDELERRA